MRKETVSLPSGAEVVLRQLLMREENILAQSARSRGRNKNNVLNTVLDSCLVEWVDVGPYTGVNPGDRPVTRSLLMGDKFVLMIELRKITYRDGEKYPIHGVECPSGSCPLFDYEVDLETDLVRRDLDEEDLAVVVSGEPFSCEIAGKKITFTLASGKTEEALEKLVKHNPGRAMSCALRSRIVDVEGVERRDILDWLDGNNGHSKTFDGLGGQECEDLRDAFDLHECGVDTEVAIECPHCGREEMLDLPFDSGFLLPSKGIKERKKNRRHGQG